MTQATQKPNDTRTLDALTGGAFTAPTAGERAARVREWLGTSPAVEQIQEVFRELSGRDKGAAKLLRERLDEIKRTRGQEAISAEWADKAAALLALPKVNIADAMAWQRDAAKAGAPLSKEPLASLKAQLADRIKGIEDLQHRVQVQREAAVLLAQRIEVLSTKSWRDAQAAGEALATDVPDWQAQAQQLLGDANWASVDTRFPPLLEASRTQLQAVWDAFQSAVAQAVAAAQDASAPLPPVPVWADELRVARGVPAEAAVRPSRPKVDPEVRAKATAVVRDVLAKLEAEIALGHGKASAGAALALRNALKEHGKLVDDKLEGQAHAALSAAGELEGWQRWRADQLRHELVAKAEALFEEVPVREPQKRTRPGTEPAVQADADADSAATPHEAGSESSADSPADPAVDEPIATQAADAQGATQESGAAEPSAVPPATQESPRPQVRQARQRAERRPRFGGRKMQEQLRALREQWKQTDQGGPPNHALWKRFDDACNEAYKVVQAWLDKVKSEAAEHKAHRLALMEEVKAWAADNVTARDGDWKGFARILNQFESRWRDAGHLSEKAFAELQPQWKAVMQNAAAPLEAVQKQSLDIRHAMIEEARTIGAAPELRVDAVRALQQRWQAEAQRIPLDRKHEQKLWDAFRKPIDEAFGRKDEEREKAASALSDRDRTVLEASKALEAANATGDAQKIKAAMTALENALRGQAQAAAAVAAAGPAVQSPVAEQSPPSPDDVSKANDVAAPAGGEAPVDAVDGISAEGAADASTQAPAPAAAPKPSPKPVIARRGDDRPGMKKTEPAAPMRGGKFGKPGERRDDRGPRGDVRGPDARGDGRFGGGRFGDRPAQDDRGPRLGDVAFRAQRDALENAQLALKKLAAQAHGEALTQLMTAWEQRSGDQVPGQQEFGRGVTPAVRGAWARAVSAAPSGDGGEALLRLEIAAELPTPAEHLNARRALQLKLLTKRNDPSPQQTWGEDAAAVLAAPYEGATARRLQAVLKTLLRR